MTIVTVLCWRLVGKQVVLTDGRVGKVVYLNSHHMEAPLIKMEEEFVDLSRESSVQIREILAVGGVRVPYLNLDDIVTGCLFVHIDQTW